MNFESSNKLIFEVPVDLIDPHPLNPRKELGDLSELMTSIKQSGIMQNLTVIERDDMEPIRYMCLIGHRRLAAAKRVGLKTVPTAILQDITEKEQVAIMIAENMQRNDLTIAEQAGAIQLMLDFGDDFAAIADRTGLSESTVRRRAKLSQYDRGMLDKAMRRGASLLDIEKISEIRKDELREKLLKAAGTAEFKNMLQKYKDQQDEEDMLPKVLDALKDLGIRIVEKTPNGVTYAGCIYDMKSAFKHEPLSDFAKFKANRPEDAVYYAIKSTYRNGIEIWYTSRTANEKRREFDEKRRRDDRLAHDIAAMHERFQKLWKDHYMRVYTSGRIPHSLGAGALVDAIALCVKANLGWTYSEEYKKLTKHKTAECEIYLIMFLRACAMRAPTGHTRYDPDNKYKDSVLPLLLEGGYEPSSEEMAFYNGTHEIWKRGAEDGED